MSLTNQVRNYSPLTIGGATVDRVSSFEYLGVYFTEDFSWKMHIDHLVRRGNQRIYYLQRLARFRVSKKVLRTFYTGAVESLLTGSIISWFGSTTDQDQKALTRVVRSAQKSIRTSLPDIKNIYIQRCRTRAKIIIKDFCHPGHNLLSLVPSGKYYCILRTNTERLRRSFYPQAIQLLNKDTE